MAAFGAPAEIVAQVEAEQSDRTFGVWDDNAETFRIFIKLQTQWHVIQGGFIGLNYQSAEFLAKIHSIDDLAAFMDDLQAMELAALQVLNKRKD